MIRSISLNSLISWILTMEFCFIACSQILNIVINPMVIFLLCLFLLFISPKESSQDNRFLLELLCFCGYGVIVSIANDGGLGGIYSICAGIIVLFSFKNNKLSDVQLKFVFIVLVFVYAYWVIKSPTWYNLYFYNHWLGDGTLANSNGVAASVYFISILLIAFIEKFSWKKSKIIKISIFVSSIWAIYNLKARMALISVVFFWVLKFVIDKLKNKRNDAIKMTFKAGALLEVVFPCIYIWMYKNNIGNDINSFNLQEKSMFSGREIIWTNMFDGMKTLPNWLFGVGSHVNFYTGHDLNMHNSALNLLVVVGLIGMIWYFSLLFRIVFSYYNADSSDNHIWKNYLVIYFVSILIFGMTENVIFYNGYLLYTFMPLGLACNQMYCEDEKLENQ